MNRGDVAGEQPPQKFEVKLFCCSALEIIGDSMIINAAGKYQNSTYFKLLVLACDAYEPASKR